MIIAHRGASRLAPENTRAAFLRAINDDADGIEFDVRLASDGVPVVVHDSTLERLAGVEKRISDLSAAELQNVDVGSWFNREFPRRANRGFSAETVPTLGQTLSFLKGNGGLIYIELKGKIPEMPALVEAVCELIRRSDSLSRIVVKSFKLDALKLVKKILPDVRTAALFSPKVLSHLLDRNRILQSAEACGADQISLHYSLATKKFVERAREKNLSTVIWTVDNPAWVKRARRLQIDAIITNDPARMIKKLSTLI